MNRIIKVHPHFTEFQVNVIFASEYSKCIIDNVSGDARQQARSKLVELLGEIGYRFGVNESEEVILDEVDVLANQLILENSNGAVPIETFRVRVLTYVLETCSVFFPNVVSGEF